jgi:hypothetical protein
MVKRCRPCRLFALLASALLFRQHREKRRKDRRQQQEEYARRDRAQPSTDQKGLVAACYRRRAGRASQAYALLRQTPIELRDCVCRAADEQAYGECGAAQHDADPAHQAPEACDILHTALLDRRAMVPRAAPAVTAIASWPDTVRGRFARRSP